MRLGDFRLNDSFFIYLGTFLVFCVGAFARLYQIQSSGLLFDEGYTIYFSQNFQKILTHENHPPLFFLVNWLSTETFGVNEIGLRLPSLLASGLAGWFLFRATYSLTKSVGAGSLAFAFYWLSLPMIVISREARFYPLLFLWLIIYIFWINEKKGIQKKKFFFGVLLISALVSLTHYIGFIFLPVLGLFFCVDQKIKWRVLLTTIAGLLPGFIFMTFQYAHTQLESFPVDSMPAGTVDFVPFFLVKNFSVTELPNYFLGFSAVIAISAVFSGLQNKDSFFRGLSLLFCFGLIFAFFAIGDLVLGINLFHYRATLPVLIVFILAASHFINFSGKVIFIQLCLLSTLFLTDFRPEKNLPKSRLGKQKVDAFYKQAIGPAGTLQGCITSPGTYHGWLFYLEKHNRNNDDLRDIRIFKLCQPELVSDLASQQPILFLDHRNNFERSQSENFQFEKLLQLDNFSLKIIRPLKARF